MHLPKYSNPRLIVGATRVVSRETLRLQGDGDGADRDREADEIGLDGYEVKNLHVKLNKIVSKRLKLKRALTPPDELHRSKKTKTTAEEEGKPTEPRQCPEPIAFRLVSKSLPPRAIHLTPKPPKVIPVKEPSCEDTEQELKERVYRSALSAVDHEQIKQTFLVANDWKRTRLLKTTSQSGNPTSPLLLLEIPPTASLPMPWINPRLDVPPKPSPHQLPIKAVCCPIVFTAPPHRRDSRERKGKRRRGKPKNKNKLVP